MANKKKKQKYENMPAENELHGKTNSDFYKLNTDAVDRLINADASTAPEVSEAEIEKVAGKKKFKIPYVVKAVFFKWWFAGATCFFFYMGLSTYLDGLDALIVLGAALGGIMDLFINKLLRFFEVSEQQHKKFLLVEYDQFWTLFLNVFYGYVILAIVIYIYSLISLALTAMFGAKTAEQFGVEPILFGILVTLVDFAFIGIKNLLKNIINDAKKSASVTSGRKQ